MPYQKSFSIISIVMLLLLFFLLIHISGCLTNFESGEKNKISPSICPDDPECVAMMCGLPSYQSRGPLGMPSTDVQRSFDSSQPLTYPISQATIGLWGAKCEFKPLTTANIKRYLSQRGNIYIDSFRVGFGRTFNDYEMSSLYLPLTDALCGGHNFLSSDIKDRFMNYYKFPSGERCTMPDGREVEYLSKSCSYVLTAEIFPPSTQQFSMRQQGVTLESVPDFYFYTRNLIFQYRNQISLGGTYKKERILIYVTQGVGSYTANSFRDANSIKALLEDETITLPYRFDVTVVGRDESPITPELLGDYDQIWIMSTGNTQNPTLSTDERNVIVDFWNRKGRIFIAGGHQHFSIDANFVSEGIFGQGVFDIAAQPSDRTPQISTSSFKQTPIFGAIGTAEDANFYDVDEIYPHDSEGVISSDFQIPGKVADCVTKMTPTGATTSPAYCSGYKKLMVYESNGPFLAVYEDENTGKKAVFDTSFFRHIGNVYSKVGMKNFITNIARFLSKSEKGHGADYECLGSGQCLSGYCDKRYRRYACVDKDTGEDIKCGCYYDYGRVKCRFAVDVGGTNPMPVKIKPFSFWFFQAPKNLFPPSPTKWDFSAAEGWYTHFEWKNQSLIFDALTIGTDWAGSSDVFIPFDNDGDGRYDVYFEEDVIEKLKGGGTVTITFPGYSLKLSDVSKQALYTCIDGVSGWAMSVSNNKLRITAPPTFDPTSDDPTKRAFGRCEIGQNGKLNLREYGWCSPCTFGRFAPQEVYTIKTYDVGGSRTSSGAYTATVMGNCPPGCEFYVCKYKLSWASAFEKKKTRYYCRNCVNGDILPPNKLYEKCGGSLSYTDPRNSPHLDEFIDYHTVGVGSVGNNPVGGGRVWFKDRIERYMKSNVMPIIIFTGSQNTMSKCDYLNGLDFSGCKGGSSTAPGCPAGKSRMYTSPTAPLSLTDTKEWASKWLPEDLGKTGAAIITTDAHLCRLHRMTNIGKNTDEFKNYFESTALYINRVRSLCPTCLITLMVYGDDDNAKKTVEEILRNQQIRENVDLVGQTLILNDYTDYGSSIKPTLDCNGHIQNGAVRVPQPSGLTDYTERVKRVYEPILSAKVEFSQWLLRNFQKPSVIIYAGYEPCWRNIVTHGPIAFGRDLGCDSCPSWVSRCSSGDDPNRPYQFTCTNDRRLWGWHYNDQPGATPINFPPNTISASIKDIDIDDDGALFVNPYYDESGNPVSNLVGVWDCNNGCGGDCSVNEVDITPYILRGVENDFFIVAYDSGGCSFLLHYDGFVFTGKLTYKTGNDVGGWQDFSNPNNPKYYDAEFYKYLLEHAHNLTDVGIIGINFYPWQAGNTQYSGSVHYRGDLSYGIHIGIQKLRAVQEGMEFLNNITTMENYLLRYGQKCECIRCSAGDICDGSSAPGGSLVCADGTICQLPPGATPDASGNYPEYKCDTNCRTCACIPCTEFEKQNGMCNPYCIDGEKCTLPSGATTWDGYKCMFGCFRSDKCPLCKNDNTPITCIKEVEGLVYAESFRISERAADAYSDIISSLPQSEFCCLEDTRDPLQPKKYTYIKLTTHIPNQEAIIFSKRGWPSLNCGKTGKNELWNIIKNQVTTCVLGSGIVLLIPKQNALVGTSTSIQAHVARGFEDTDIRFTVSGGNGVFKYVFLLVSSIKFPLSGKRDLSVVYTGTTTGCHTIIAELLRGGTAVASNEKKVCFHPAGTPNPAAWCASNGC